MPKCSICKIKINPGEGKIIGIKTLCSEKCNQEFYKQYLKQEKAKVRKEKEKIQIRKVKKKEKKHNSISYLTKQLDRIVSEYIRKRDCLITSGNLNYGICITCGEKKEYSQFDCGHFITRSNKNTRWEEKNMSLQCNVCNCWGGGRQYEHGVALDKKWGKGTAQELLENSKQIKKITSFELQEMIESYKKMLQNLQINK